MNNVSPVLSAMGIQAFKPTALTNCDSYKLGHADQYPEGTTKVYSNFTPRSDKYFQIPKEYSDGKIVWAGLQIFLADLVQCWEETFFSQDRETVVQEFGQFVVPFVGPRGFALDRLRELHDLGYLPLEIMALPEGVRVPVGVPVLTITNTLPAFYWLPNFLETWMSCELWKPATSASISYAYRKIIDKYAEKTGGFAGFVQWQGHDFSVRGMSGIVDAAKSGFGHLLSFTGTDNLPAVNLINQVYCGKKTFVGGSVPATEHSVMCAGGMATELETFRRLLKVYPSGVVSIVSDTWDYWNVLTTIAVELKEEILARTPDQFGLAKVVFRPDSGDPVENICGIEIEDFSADADDLDEAAEWFREELVDREADEAGHGCCGASEVTGLIRYQGKVYRVSVEIDWNRYDKQYYYVDGSRVKKIEEVELTPEQKGSVEVLWDIFGGTTNEKGYRTLNQRVGLIYGDSITLERCEAILKRLADKGFASDNIVFGIGSYTFQFNTRDTLGWAMKATYVEINGEGLAIFKAPKTDGGTKKSAKGLLKVEWNGDRYVLVEEAGLDDIYTGAMRPVFRNGALLIVEEFENLRTRLASQ